MNLINPTTNQPVSPSTINVANTGFTSLSAIQSAAKNTPIIFGSPSLAHRDKKINLNYPLPVSNDPNEPIRQKWISDTYQLLKVILPPTSVDSPEELAQLSQFVINIIDFRDPDATMTHWVNPDVMLNPGTVPTSTPPAIPPAGTPYTVTVPGITPAYLMAPPGLVFVGSTGVTAATPSSTSTAWSTTRSRSTRCWPTPSRAGRTRRPASAVYTNRFFVELVNTLTAAYNPTFDYGARDDALRTTTATGRPTRAATTTTTRAAPTRTSLRPPPMQASTLDLGGFTYVKNDPYRAAAGTWSSPTTTR